MIYIISDNKEKWSGFNLVSVEDAVEVLSKSDELAVDLETTGLSFLDNTIRTIAFYDKQNVYIADIEDDESKITVYKDILQTKFLLFQNGIFDIPFLYKYSIIPDKLYDTHLAETNLSLGITVWRRDLEELIKMYCGVVVDKSLQKKINTAPLNTPEAVQYMANDVLYLFDIREKQMLGLQKYGNKKAVDLDCQFIKVLAYIEYCGIAIDEDKLKRLYRRLEYEEYKVWLELNEFLKDTDIDHDDFNWDSTQQVVDLFKILNIDCWDKKGKKYSVESSVLKKLNPGNEVVETYLKYKKVAKSTSTYGRTFINHINPKTKRIHTKFKALVSTGRTSCGDAQSGAFPNLQNIPHDKLFRGVYKPTHGRVYINMDYSQQEPCVLAEASQEPALLDFFLEGSGDYHSYIAKQIFADEVGDTPESEIKDKFPRLRSDAKAVGFTLSFGGGINTLAENSKKTIQEAAELYNKYFETFPALKGYFEETQTKALEVGYIPINNITGRKRFLEQFKFYKQNKYNNKNVRSYESQVYRLCTNTPIQGTAADISKTACVLIFNWIVKNKRFGKTKMVNFVHDEILIETSSAKAQEEAKIFELLMVEAGRYYLKKIPLRVSVKISDKWEH